MRSRLPLPPLASLVAAAAVAAVGCLAPATPARAQLARLATSPGDGGVAVQVDPYGAFGYRTFGNGSGGTGDALYDPVGGVGPSSTSWESAVYLRNPPQSTFLTIGTVGQGTPSGGLPDPGFLTADGVTATSAFAHAGVEWELTQGVQDLVVGASRVGTLLVQEYLIRNPGPASVSFDLVRYFEGDLFLGLGAGVPDGGGRLLVGPEELLFETDLAGEPAATTNLVGITACGGMRPAAGRYEVGQWPAFPTRITSDRALGDLVFNDGADPDELVDAGLDHDVGIALANEIDLLPGEAVLYITTTVFGTLPPEDLSEGCGLLTHALAAAGSDVTACPGESVTLDGTASLDPDPADGGVTPTSTWDLDFVADPVDWDVGPTLCASRQPDGSPLLDWSLAGPPPPDVRFAVLREPGARPPVARAPGADALLGSPWADGEVGDPLVLYDVRATPSDDTLSED